VKRKRMMRKKECDGLGKMRKKGKTGVIEKSDKKGH